MLRGNAPAKIDDKGRLKVPNAFRAVIQKEHGPDVFVTSLTGQSVRIYPMPVWVELEKRLAQVPSTNPARQRFLDRVNFYGQVAELDAQGRVVIHPRLRDSAQITGDVDVLFLMNDSNNTYNAGRVTNPSGPGPVEVGVLVESDAISDTDWPKYLGGSFKVVIRGTAAADFASKGAKADLQLMFTFAAFE